MCLYAHFEQIIFNLNMKKIVLTLAVVLASFGFANAQDMETAVNLYNEAGTLLNEGNKEESLPKFLECLEMAKGLGEEAVNVVGDCQDIIPQIYMKLGEEAAEASEFDAALTNFKKVVELATEYDNNADAAERATNLIPKMYMAKGGALLNAKSFAEAAEAFKNAVEADETNTTALLRLGIALAGSGEADSAIVVFNRASEAGAEAEANKQLSNIYLKKAQADLKASKFKEAIADCEASNGYVENANAYKLAASAASQLKDNAKAISFYEKYVELAPTAKDASSTASTVLVACVKK